MANASKPEIETVEDEDDPRLLWPKNGKALTMGNLTKRSLENKVRTGEAVYIYDSTGERHFDPEWLNQLAGVVTETDVEADLTKSIFADLRRALSDMTKSNKDLLALATGPSFAASKLIKKENKALRKRCRQLESDRIKSIDAYEAALTATHDRELERERIRSQEARKDKGFDILMGQLPELVSQLSGKKKLSGLLETLTTEQKAVLFELLTPAQLQVVTTIMAQVDSDNKKRSPPGKPTDSANGTSQPAGDTGEQSS